VTSPRPAEPWPLGSASSWWRRCLYLCWQAPACESAGHSHTQEATDKKILFKKAKIWKDRSGSRKDAMYVTYYG
jgi:hypothetical protein